MDRIATIAQQLGDASVAYYGDGDSLLSDAQFDALKDELEQLDPGHLFLSQIGALIGDGALTKVKHVIAMGSLKKISHATGDKDFSTWLNSIASATGPNPVLTVQSKLDGSSVSLTYVDGRFKQAVTRGDGFEGEDVTHALRLARGVPKRINQKGTIYVRGEAILRIKIWEKHLSNDSSNPRNSAAGLVRRTDTSQAHLLNFLAFDTRIGDDENDLFAAGDSQFKTVEEQIEWLKDLNFDAVETIVVPANQVASVVAHMLAQRPNSSYEIDGSVVKVNSLEHQQKLGEHKQIPYHSRAWKFPPMGGHSTLLDVEWNVGTRGSVDPKAIIEPTHVGGVIISNVTLHNMDEIERLGIQIGDKIEVIRAGDVIPKIVRVVKTGANRSPIECPVCPSCGSATKRDGPILRCTNMDSCGGVHAKRIKKWISKRNIQFLGDSNLGKLIKGGSVGSVRDLYFLTLRQMTDAGVGESMGRKILAEIEKSMKCSLSELVGSLSIDLLGRSQAQNVIDQGIGTIFQWKNLTAADLNKLNGFGGGSKSQRIIAGLQKNWKQIEDLASILEIEEGSATHKKVKGSGKLAGRSFCFTGKMSQPRGKMEAMAAANGGEVHSKVSKGLTHLVIADPSSTSSKARDARRHGTVLISEADFMAMIT